MGVPLVEQVHQLLAENRKREEVEDQHWGHREANQARRRQKHEDEYEDLHPHYVLGRSQYPIEFIRWPGGPHKPRPTRVEGGNDDPPIPGKGSERIEEKRPSLQRGYRKHHIEVPV